MASSVYVVYAVRSHDWIHKNDFLLAAGSLPRATLALCSTGVGLQAPRGEALEVLYHTGTL
jgi:hypothetical protein